MQNNRQLFDQNALLRHRARTKTADPSVWFLHRIAAVQVSERLKEINRSFTDIAIVGWKAALWADEIDVSANLIDDRETLNLQEASCDLVIGGLGLHWSNDPVGQLIQMRRALRPDGLMIAVLFAGRTLRELRQAFIAGELQTEGGISPHIAPMAEIRSLGALLQRADFALPVADTVSLTVNYNTPLHLMRELRAMGETNILTDRKSTLMKRATLAAMVAEYRRLFSTDGDRVTATFELGFLTGWHPSETQQKPLKPGSANSRLADFLDGEESN